MKILILGRGYVGQNIAKTMATCYDVTILSRADLDYTDRSTLFNHMSKAQYAYVINTCGYTGRPNVDACEANREDTWYYNVIVPVNIQKVCKDVGTKMIHISSGCIYDGYDKKYTEEDEPDFGLLSTSSSWYSKTKHACEMMLRDTPVYILRIRMPFCETSSERNIIMKLRKYDKIINKVNSLTNIEDLCGFCLLMMADINENISNLKPGIYNVVNPQEVSTQEIAKIMEQYGIGNPNWKTIEYDELMKMTSTGRSNCVLDDSKVSSYNLKLPNTFDSLHRCARNISDQLR